MNQKNRVDRTILLDRPIRAILKTTGLSTPSNFNPAQLRGSIAEPLA
jgi:hypothetical protein